MGYIHRLTISIAIILYLMGPFSAFAENRVALIVGNSAYQNTAPLVNPINDAKDIAAALERLDFDVVLGLDLDYKGMQNVVRQFSTKLSKADVALFYYAGHALQVKGVNYLVPVDTKLQSESDLVFETVSLNTIQAQMEQKAKTLLVFLDACRNNPLTRSFTRSTNGQGSGLARPATSPEGEFISFSTQPGNVALDGSGRNSPFTKALLNHIETPGIEISAMMTNVRKEVYQATNQQQLPWTNSALLGHFYFAPGDVSPEDNRNKLPAEIERFQTETAAWNKIKHKGDAELVRQFQKQFANGFYKSISADTLRLLETNTPRNEQTKTASLDPKDTIGNISIPTPASDPEGEKEMIRSLQKELGRIGCDAGRADGIWGKKSQAALENYSKTVSVNYSLDNDLALLLETLNGHKTRICPLVCSAKYRNSGNECILKSCTAGKSLNSKGACISIKKSIRKKVVIKRKRKKTVVRKAVSNRNCFKFNGKIVCE